MALTNKERTLKLKVQLDIAQSSLNAEKLEGALKKLDSGSKKYKATLARLNVEVQRNINAKERLNQMMFKVKQTQETLDTSTNQLIKGKDGKGGLSGVSAASGSASAATLELGRVISDAPYGIRGMANNVSQLASNLVYASTTIDAATNKAIGFSGAMKAMWASIKGPLGVLLAIQVVISALDFLFGAQKKTEDSTKSLTKSYVDQATELNSLIRVLGDSNLSLEKRAELEQIVIDKLPNVDRANTKTKEGLEKLTKEVETYIEQQMLRIEIDKLVSDNADELAEHRERQRVLEAIKSAESQEEQIKIIKENTNILDRLAIEAMGADGKGLIARLISGEGRYGATDLAAGFEAFVNEEGADAIKILEQIDELTRRYLNIKKKNGGNGGPKSVKEFKQNILDLSSILNDFRNTEIQNMDITEEERLRLEYETSKKSVENKVQEFQEKEKLRLDDKIKQIKDSKATEDEKARLIADANAKYNASIVQANADKNEVMLQADIAYYSELAALRRKDTENAKEETNKLIAATRDSQYEYQEFNEQEKINKTTNELDRIKAEGDASEKLTELKVENLKKQALEEGKTAADIQEINNEISRLNHDHTLRQQELDRRAAATKLAIANQVADAIINIAGEGTTIAKGVAIAQTIWNTKQGVMNALGTITPYGPWNIAQAAAIAAMGVKNVADIINTKAPNEKSSGVSAAGAGGGTTFMPDFNIVGASGQNQLASTIAGQVGEPTRAYVVYDDLRTAGEIEANAVTAAGI